MRDYSVVIRLQGQTKGQIESRLRAAFGDAAEEAQIIEAGKLVDCYEACRVNGHFGCVHWTDEDLLSKLGELNSRVTTDVLDAVKSGYALRHVDDRMIELGWMLIEQAILDAGVPQKT